MVQSSQASKFQMAHGFCSFLWIWQKLLIISEHLGIVLLFADLPLKNLYYPTERNAKGLGIVLASYTWGGDSTRLLGMPDEELFEEMMEGMAKIHERSFK